MGRNGMAEPRKPRCVSYSLTPSRDYYFGKARNVCMKYYDLQLNNELLGQLIDRRGTDSGISEGTLVCIESDMRGLHECIRKALRTVRRGRKKSKICPHAFTKSIFVTAARCYASTADRLRFIHYFLVRIGCDYSASFVDARNYKTCIERYCGYAKKNSRGGHEVVVGIEYRFKWPTTQHSGVDSGLRPEDVLTLSREGYRVGKNSTLGQDMRRTILSNIISPKGKIYGSGESIAKLRFVANTLAALTRRAKGRSADCRTPIARWESDLQYLYSRYYVNLKFV